MKQRSILLILLLGSFLECFAEGQDGWGTLIFIFYALAILLFTFVGALLTKMVVKILKIKDSTSFWFYIMIFFITALLLALIMSQGFLPGF